VNAVSGTLRVDLSPTSKTFSIVSGTFYCEFLQLPAASAARAHQNCANALALVVINDRKRLAVPVFQRYSGACDDRGVLSLTTATNAT
jgi:hypothetical protein